MIEIDDAGRDRHGVVAAQREAKCEGPTSTVRLGVYYRCGTIAPDPLVCNTKSPEIMVALQYLDVTLRQFFRDVSLVGFGRRHFGA